MSRIDELIAEHCPNGVEFRTLASVTSQSSGIKWAASGDTAFKYIDLSSVDRVTRQIGETVSVTAEDAPSRARQIVRTGDVIFATTRPMQMRWAVIPEEYDGQIASTGYCVLRPDDSVVMTNFLAHVLGAAGFSRYVEANQIEGNYPSIPDSRIRQYKIPIPPVNIQRVIVDILDTFSKMEAELEAELEARKVQHSYFWNDLLKPSDDWLQVTIGDVAEVFDGPHATPKKTTSGPWYLSISSLIGGRFDLTKSARLSEDEFPKWTRRVEAKVGDTMFSYETRLGQAAFWEKDEPAALGRRMGILRPDPSKIYPRFLTLIYLGPSFQALIKLKTVSGSTVDRIPIRDMATWPIQIPCLEEQIRLVETLDAFDALVNDLSVGLPAELAARRQQYEYYRDKLLTFKELEVTA